MSSGRLNELITVTQGRLRDGDPSYVGVSTDTRTLTSGELFVALVGPNFDGHDYVERAAELGAAAALVSRELDIDLPQLIVDDTQIALGEIAAAWRARFDIPVIAVTGSNGKTSVKEMIAAILGMRGETLATRGNFNNEIGVPLTLLRLQRRHRAAVIEMGASRAGDIAYLTKLVKPTIGIVTNAAPAHLEGFGTLEGVARAKGELFAALSDSGVAIVNADDPFSSLWRELTGSRTTLTFGKEQDADFSFADITQKVNGASASLRFQLDGLAGAAEVLLPMAGRHNARNAACAAAAAFAADASLDDIVGGLERSAGIAGRMQITTARCGARVIDDSYNANPESARAAIAFLAEQKEPGWLVLGDMAELGSNAPHLHAEIGKRARELGIERLFATGKLARAAVAAFGEGAEWFEDADTLGAALREALHDDLNVLVKGSRTMRLERVVDALECGHKNEEAVE